MPTVESSRSHFVSSILIVGKPPSDFSLGADVVSEAEKALALMQKSDHYVFVVHSPIENPERFNIVFRDLRKANKFFEVIVYGTEINPLLFEGFRIFRFIDSTTQDYEKAIQQAVERVQHTKQNQQLLELIHAQNKRLLSLGRSVEERISKRQAYLQKTHLSITETNHRGEAFQRALIAIHRSNSIGEMERLLTEAIADAFKMSWVRIVLGQNRFLREQMERDRLHIPVYSVELRLQNEVVGSVSFGRKKENFNRAEKDLLTQISDSISLALSRLKILRDTEEIKMQWEATFNSITSPLALVDDDYTVLRANGAFLQHHGTENQNTKCYELLMNRTSPCENCQLGTKFRVDLSGKLGKVSILDVSSQKISGQDVYVNVYRDISSQLQIETRIMESAKVAELGTIGSSIAHELNNPLGGIITFLQLIRMDLKGNEKYYSDIIALEEAAQKCKEIIQNLLSFSRSPESEEQEKLDLNTVVKRAVQIVELQSRSSEVVVTTELSKENLPISSNFGMITQALMTYFQLAIETARSQQIQPIRLKIISEKANNKSVISILSPKVSASLLGPQILRRTIAERILADLGATVEYFAEMEDQLTVKIAFGAQKFPSEV